jgi:O-antigen/teichoic acid export membrane protein
MSTASGSTARRVTVGLVDQVVIALANAGNNLLALALLDRARAGVMLLSLGVGYFVIGVNRAFVGEVLLTLASRYEGARQERLIRNGAGAALVVAGSAAVLLLVAWLAVPASGGVDLRDLVWVAPFLPSLLLHDTARYGYLADRRPQRALVIDATWVGTQLLAVLLITTTGHVSAGGLFTCWGLGATAGATVFLLRSRIRPWRGSPRQWLAETRHLAGWFTATALVGQFQGQAVGFLVASRLSARELSGLRGAQTALLQPAQNFITAVMGLLVPRFSRLAARSESAALRRQARLLALCFAVLGALLVAVVVPVARTVLVRLPKFADIAPLALPIAIQPAIYLVQLPFAAALRGMHRARLLFLQYLAFTGTSLTGLVVGARLDRLPGAAWGLTIGSAVGLVVMIGFYLYSSRAGLPRPAPAEDGVADRPAQAARHEPDLQEGQVVEDTGPAVPHRLA